MLSSLGEISRAGVLQIFSVTRDVLLVLANDAAPAGDGGPAGDSEGDDEALALVDDRSRCRGRRIRPKRSRRGGHPRGGPGWPSRCTNAPPRRAACRSEDLTIGGYTHDVCSTVHPLLVASPFFGSFDLDALGVRLKTPRVAVAHPLEGGRGAAIFGSVDDTAETLGTDRGDYRRIFGPLVRDGDGIARALLAPIRSIPTPVVPMVRFGACCPPPR